MNAILGYAQLLQRAPDLQPRQREGIDTIANSGDHLLALINDVLGLSTRRFLNRLPQVRKVPRSEERV